MMSLLEVSNSSRMIHEHKFSVFLVLGFKFASDLTAGMCVYTTLCRHYSSPPAANFQLHRKHKTILEPRT